MVRDTRTILSEQLDDVDNRDDDSSETYDVEEVMTFAKLMKLHLRMNVAEGLKRQTYKDSRFYSFLREEAVSTL